MQTVVTHSGSFDPDDVLAVATVTLFLGKDNYEIVRSRDQKVIEQADWVVDVGGKYDPATRRFDHHQNGVPKRKNQVPYSSFGLVWDEIGEEVCGSASVAQKIEERIVCPIDAADNEMRVCNPNLEGVSPYEFFDIINTFKPRWGSDEDFHTGFMRAVSFARRLIKRQIGHEQSEEMMLEYVREVFAKARDRSLLEFDKPIARHVVANCEGVKFFVSPVFAMDTRDWMAVAVPKTTKGFDHETLFPEAWAGLSGAELVEVSGIAEAVFCHKERYIFVAKTKESSLEAVRKTLAEN